MTHTVHLLGLGQALWRVIIEVSKFASVSIKTQPSYDEPTCYTATEQRSVRFVFSYRPYVSGVFPHDKRFSRRYCLSELAPVQGFEP